MKKDTLLEVRRRPFGVGYHRQNWPATRHHIARMGWLEARLIVPNDERVGLVGGTFTLIAGLVLACVR